MELLEIKDYKYHYQKSKNKSKGTIVFIHGFATMSKYHNGFANLLKDYDYYALELPGHGITEAKDLSVLSPYNLALSVVEWIKLMDFKDFYLIGHSMGGGIVGMVSTMIPELIKKLVMVTPMNSSYSLKLLNIVKFNPKNNKETFEMQKVLYKNHLEFFDNENHPDILEETKYQLEHRNKFVKLLANMSSLSNMITLKKLEKLISVPTLLILGQHDGIIDYKTATKLFGKKQNFKIELFENSGHLPFIEELNKYYNLVISFIESN